MEAPWEFHGGLYCASHETPTEVPCEDFHGNPRKCGIFEAPRKSHGRFTGMHGGSMGLLPLESWIPTAVLLDSQPP